MEIESNEDLTLVEPPLTFGELIEGDVFREAHIPYQEALDSNRFFMKLSSASAVVNLHTGNAKIMKDAELVIVHIATVVVTPNV